MKLLWLQKIIRNFQKKALSSVDGRGWIPIVYESFLGAWQQNIEVTAEVALSHPIVYACITQIAGDLGKLRLRLTEHKESIWQETESAAFSPVLRNPNRYQTRQKFIEQWVISKLINGNAYMLKERDARGIVVALYVLDPMRVWPLVADNGSVFYSLQVDNLSSLDRQIPAAPASEIIHDRMECLFHPLVGIPPMFAGALAVKQGLNIQKQSSYFFGNNSRPSGILTAPGVISEPTAARLKTDWQANYTGENSGKVAVLGDGLKYDAISQTALDSQLVEQLKWSDEKICSIFKVPPYKVFVGPMPTYDNAEVLDKIYYAGCLQRLIEAIESLLDDGLSLPSKYGTEFDLDDLMRMDSALLMRTAAEGVKSGFMSPNEARAKISLGPVKGGQSPYLQQQNYSLAALDERDKKSPLAVQPPPPAPAPPTQREMDEEADMMISILNAKGVLHV
jgi:HK97 family phage portal protein